MSNNSLNKKRKDPMVGLIVLAVLMVVYLLDQRDGVNTIFWFLN